MFLHLIASDIVVNLNYGRDIVVNLNYRPFIWHLLHRGLQAQVWIKQFRRRPGRGGPRRARTLGGQGAY